MQLLWFTRVKSKRLHSNFCLCKSILFKLLSLSKCWVQDIVKIRRIIEPRAVMRATLTEAIVMPKKSDEFMACYVFVVNPLQWRVHAGAIFLHLSILWYWETHSVKTWLRHERSFQLKCYNQAIVHISIKKNMKHASLLLSTPELACFELVMRLYCMWRYSMVLLYLLISTLEHMS